MRPHRPPGRLLPNSPRGLRSVWRVRRQADREDEDLLFTGDLAGMADSRGVFNQKNATDRETPRRSVTSRNLIFAPHSHEYLAAWGWVHDIPVPIRWYSNPIAPFRPQELCDVKRFRWRNGETGLEVCAHIFKSGQSLAIGIEPRVRHLHAVLLLSREFDMEGCPLRAPQRWCCHGIRNPPGPRLLRRSRVQ